MATEELQAAWQALKASNNDAITALNTKDLGVETGEDLAIWLDERDRRTAIFDLVKHTGRSEVHVLRNYSSLLNAFYKLASVRASGDGVGVVETGMKRFAELLQQVCVDPKPDVIDYAQRFLSDQIRVADTPAAALNVYNIAQSLPHTETRLAIKDHQRLLVNGLYKANVISRSVFLYVFDHDSMEASLLKMPCDAVKGRREAEICDSIEKLGRHEHLVGPIRRVPLEGHLQDFGEATIGLLMPLYGATLFHVPKSLSYERVAIVGEQVLSALKHLHEGGWCHNDIKASNIFLDKGRAFLGDFGSARRTGEDTPERTMSYVPDDLPTGINVFKASEEVDKVQLAITLLLHTGTLQAPAKGWSISDPVKYGDICKAANGLEDSRLKKLMKSLLL